MSYQKIQRFIGNYGLQPADAIVAHKKGYRILEHFIIYMGQDEYGTHWFMANAMQGGVRYYNAEGASELLDSFQPINIRRFQGNDWQRHKAIERASSQQGKRYNLLSYNCEHFANYVQYGKMKSPQAAAWGTFGALASVAIIAGVISTR